MISGKHVDQGVRTLCPNENTTLLLQEIVIDHDHNLHLFLSESIHLYTVVSDQKDHWSIKTYWAVIGDVFGTKDALFIKKYTVPQERLDIIHNTLYNQCVT